MKKKIVALMAVISVMLCKPVLIVEALPSAPVKIAVIDSGISTEAIFSKHLEKGKNYLDSGEKTEDKIGHGTAIAGIMVGSEKAGIKGICEDAVLVPLLTADLNGEGKVVTASPHILATAVREAIDVFDCRIINLSAGTKIDDPALREAIAYAEKEGAVVVSAVGNDGDEGIYYPAAYDTVLGVGSLNTKGEVASFSQKGEAVSICAPGDRLRVVGIKGAPIFAFGTSYSAAYVSGTAAKLISAYPELLQKQVRQILCSSSLDMLDEGWDKESGWGALRQEEAMRFAQQGLRFRDVFTDSWYKEAVKKVTDSGWFKGVDETHFAPEETITRVMLWTILARMDGCLLKESQTWKEEARKWVIEKGISDGSASDFPITREQMITLLLRYGKSEGKAIGNKNLEVIPEYSDQDQISDWAREAVRFGVSNKLLCGDSEGFLMPKKEVTRAQVAVILVRYQEIFAD